jgi:hypothetical protein
MEDEFKNKINFLDITISKDDSNIPFSTYRKPTATNTIIPNDLCHPREQELAAVRYLTKCLSKYAMNNTEKRKENYIIKQIIHNNKYDIAILNVFSRTKNEQEYKKEE